MPPDIIQIQGHGRFRILKPNQSYTSPVNLKVILQRFRPSAIYDISGKYHVFWGLIVDSFKHTNGSLSLQIILTRNAWFIGQNRFGNGVCSGCGMQLKTFL